MLIYLVLQSWYTASWGAIAMPQNKTATNSNDNFNP